MKVFRRNLSANVEDLRDIIEKVLSDDFYNSDDLKKAMNGVISSSNFLNCVFQKDDPDFVEMDDLEVKYLDDEEDEES